jgi:hypothetical protein
LLPKHHPSPSCSHYNAIYNSRVQNTILVPRSRSSEKPLSSHPTTICRDCGAKHIIAKRQQPKTKSHLEASLPMPAPSKLA